MGIYLLKVNNRNTRTWCEIYSKLTTETPTSFWTYLTPCSSVSIVNFEHVIADWVSPIVFTGVITDATVVLIGESSKVSVVLATPNKFLFAGVEGAEPTAVDCPTTSLVKRTFVGDIK